MYNSSIMTGIGSGNTRFSAIADKIGRKTTEISVPLKNLQEMSYVEKEVPFGEDGEKTRKTLYWISDPFMCTSGVAPQSFWKGLGNGFPMVGECAGQE